MHPTTLNKAWQDGENLYRYARAVIVIDEQGSPVEVIDRVTGSLVNVLAILGPITIGKTYIDRAVRAEIGFGRTSPYKLAEKMIHDEKIVVLLRKVYLPLSEEDQLALLPVITRFVQKIIDKEIEHRKRLTYYKSHRPDSVEFGNGKFITIPSNLPILMFVCLAKDMQTRVNGHIQEVAYQTKWRLMRVRYASYTPAQLRRLNAAQSVAEIFGDAKYSEYLLEIIRQKVGKVTTKERALFELILEVFNIVPSEEYTDQNIYFELKKKYGDLEIHLLDKFHLDTVTHPKRSIKNKKIREDKQRVKERKTKTAIYKHANNCIRIEVRPSQEAIKQHGHRSNQPERKTK